LSFDDRLELGLASIDDMPAEQTSLLGADEQIAPETPEAPVVKREAAPAPVVAVAAKPTEKSVADPAAPMCYNCGNQTQKAGSCYVCTSCGSTTGCS
jgi:ribonucleoside-diphosphate reductase alpha chain